MPPAPLILAKTYLYTCFTLVQRLEITKIIVLSIKCACKAGLTRLSGMKTEEFIPILTKEIKKMLILTLFSPFLQFNSVVRIF